VAECAGPMSMIDGSGRIEAHSGLMMRWKYSECRERTERWIWREMVVGGGPAVRVIRGEVRLGDVREGRGVDVVEKVL
jgi:hypothetical protein